VSRMRKRRSIWETMLTTSTESRPSPSRRLESSSRSGYCSPVSASSSSMSVRRMVSRSGMIHLPGVKRIPRTRAQCRCCLRKENNFRPFWQERLAVDPRQLEHDAMAFLFRFLFDEAQLAVVPGVHLDISPDAVMLAVVHLSPRRELLRAEELQS